MRRIWDDDGEHTYRSNYSYTIKTVGLLKLEIYYTGNLETMQWFGLYCCAPPLCQIPPKRLGVFNCINGLSP
jgi:hypothetical protein